jgi:hypothetical protein
MARPSLSVRDKRQPNSCYEGALAITLNNIRLVQQFNHVVVEWEVNTIFV